MYVGRYMYNFVFLKFYRSTVDFQCANFCCTSKLFSYIHVCVCVYIYIYIYILFLRFVVTKMRVGKGRIGSLGFTDAN